MSNSIRTLVALDAGVDTRAIDPVLEDPRLDVVAVIEDEATWAASHTTAADALIVACSPNSDGALDFIAQAVADRPDRPVIAVCTAVPNGHVPDFFRAGADDLVALAEEVDDLVGALVVGDDGLLQHRDVRVQVTQAGSHDRPARGPVAVPGQHVVGQHPHPRFLPADRRAVTAVP